jgi:hypothetical protein
MSEINHFNVFDLCKIMWYDVVIDLTIVDDVSFDNW